MEFDIQLFGAGENVAGTEGYVNAATGETASYGSGGLSAEMKTFYDKTLISMASPNLVHDQLGQKRPIPKNGGRTIEFRRFSSLPKALKPITEGVTPAGNKLAVSTVSATVDQYGDYVEQTDLLELSSVDNVIVETTKKLADQAAMTLDTVVRDVINAGTNVMYCPKVTAEGEMEVKSRKEITKDSKLRVTDVFRAAAELKAMNAPKIDGSYVAVIHPYVAYDLMQEAGDRWCDVAKYVAPESILSGEIGKIGGVRFVETSEAKIFAPCEISDGYCRLTLAEAASATKTVKINETLTPSASVSVPVYVGGTANLITAIGVSGGVTTLTLAQNVTASKDELICGQGAGKDGSAVFSTLFMGADAFGTTDIAGGGIEHIVKQKGYGNDPLNQRSSIGWKALKTCEILVEEYLLRVESSSSYSDVADMN